MDPVEEFVEGEAGLVGGDIAVAVAVDVLLNEFVAVPEPVDELVVPGRVGGWNERVVDGVDFEELAAEIAGGRIPVGEEAVGVGVRGVAVDALIEEGVVVGSGVDEVAVVKGIAAGFEAKVFDDEGVEDEDVSESAIGMDVGELANDGGLLRAGVESLLDGGGGGNVVHHERGGDVFNVRKDAGKKGVECDAVGEGALHYEIGGSEYAAEGEAAGILFGVLFKRHEGEQAAHGVAHEEGFAGRAVFAAEMAAESFGFGSCLGKRPSADGVAGARDGVAAVEDFLKDAARRIFGIEGETRGFVAMEIEDEAMVPVFGDVDAVGRAVEGTGFRFDGNCGSGWSRSRSGIRDGGCRRRRSFRTLR